MYDGDMSSEYASIHVIIWKDFSILWEIRPGLYPFERTRTVSQDCKAVVADCQ
jgi:hypothetical protein